MKTCKQCNIEKELSEFHKHSKLKDGHMHICKECVSNRTYEMEMFSQAFLDNYWAKVDKSGECWEWQGSRSSYRPVTKNRPVATKGYGNLKINNKVYYAHRIAFFIENGYLSPDLVIDHICENTLCVRPSHLRELTRQENAMRSPRHSKNHGYYPRLNK